MATLIHFSLDPFSRRIRLALAEYGLAVEMLEEEPWAPSADIFALNPAGTLPIYMEDNSTAICGIEAIGEYLEETRMDRAGLIPGDVFCRAEVRRLVGWFDTKFYAEVSEPALTEKIMRRFLGREAGGGAPDMGRWRARICRLPISPLPPICRSLIISEMFRGRNTLPRKPGTSGSSPGPRSGPCWRMRCGESFRPRLTRISTSDAGGACRADKTTRPGRRFRCGWHRQGAIGSGNGRPAPPLYR
jgi:hypothetical protein